MSILVVQILPQGILFGADRNITETRIGSDASGRSITVIQGQSQRSKVLRWPNRKALVGYVGAASIGGIPSNEWLYDYIGHNLDFPNFETLAHDMTETVQKVKSLDDGQSDPEALIIHLAGFEQRDAQYVPVVWYIRNAYGMKDGFYNDIRKEFLCTEEFWAQFPNVPPEQIRDYLNHMASQNKPFWFHQGLDLGTFNTLDAFLRGAFLLLCKSHPAHSFPQTLDQWQQHLRMTILTYEAYYQAFKGVGEQYVGGGVDAVSLDWP